jgi:hypothetical protein
MSTQLFRRELSARLRRIAGGPLALALLGLASCSGTKKIECIDWDSQLGACPSRDEALEEMKLDETCKDVHQSVDSDGKEQDGQCCYEVTVTDDCCYGPNCPVAGRPLVAGGEALMAPAVRGETGWSAAATPVDRAPGEVRQSFPREVRQSLPIADHERAALAGMWLRSALQEHASIASFGRFALELLAFGAPPELVAAAHLAALDEIRHARACFALASRHAGEPLGPGAFPMPSPLPLAGDLAAMAAAVVEEGCVGETLAALFAAEQRAAASDHEVCAALDAIVAEEAQHSELAWRAVRWALAVGGADVRRAVEQAFARSAGRAAAAAGEPLPPDIRPEVVAAHGLLPAEAFRRVSAQAVREVILPCARAMGLFTKEAAASAVA